MTFSCWRHLIGDRRAGHADPGAQVGDVGVASGSPSTSTVPCVGTSSVAATCSSVVLPAPFGPMMTQLSSLRAVQLTSRSSIDRSYLTPTSRSLSTSAAIRFPPSATIPA